MNYEDGNKTINMTGNFVKSVMKKSENGGDEK